jgi:hypothetical protein
VKIYPTFYDTPFKRETFKPKIEKHCYATPFFTVFVQKFKKKNPKLCHKLNFSNHFIFLTFFTLLIFQTLIIWSHRILSLKYLRSKIQGCKDIGFRTSEFVAKTRFLSVQVAWSEHIVLISQTDNIILASYIKVSFELVKLISTSFFPEKSNILLTNL